MTEVIVLEILTETIETITRHNNAMTKTEELMSAILSNKMPPEKKMATFITG
jgi:hypothetical protein